MTHRSNTVVSKSPSLTKQQVHALLMQGWARAIAKHGKGGFADACEISTVALDKQLTGSMPGFEVIDKALDACPTVLDEYVGAKGLRLVPKEATCDIDDLNVTLARALVKINEATHPDSPGGRRVVHGEYLDGEEVMRALHKATGEWLQACADLRRPRSVA